MFDMSSNIGTDRPGVLRWWRWWSVAECGGGVRRRRSEGEE
jgi:hypothetical protein